MSRNHTVTLMDPADDTRQAKLDNLVPVLVGIDYAHHEIHEGDSFHAYVTTADLGAANIGFRFTTPAGTKRVHMVISATSAEDALLTFYEAGTPAGGGAFTPLNRFRGGSASALADVYAGAVTTGGSPVTLNVQRWGATGVGPRTGSAGGDRGTHEWVLEPSTSYHVIMSGSGNEAATLQFDWYEHTDS